MKKFLIIFLVGLILLPSCSIQKNNSDNEKQLNSSTQIEFNQEDQAKSTVSRNAVIKQSFRLEHPILFTLLVICSLGFFVLIVYIITTKISDTIFGPVATGIGNAIGDGFATVLSKLSKIFDK